MPPPDRVWVLKLCVACRSGDQRKVHDLLQSAEMTLGTDGVKEVVNGRDDNGRTPLTCAVASRDMFLVMALLEHGADKAAKGAFESTMEDRLPGVMSDPAVLPLDLARQLQAEEIVDVLLQFGQSRSLLQTDPASQLPAPRRRRAAAAATTTTTGGVNPAETSGGGARRQPKQKRAAGGGTGGGGGGYHQKEHLPRYSL